MKQTFGGGLPRRALSLLVGLAMVLGVCPATGLAEEVLGAEPDGDDDVVLVARGEEGTGDGFALEESAEIAVAEEELPDVVPAEGELAGVEGVEIATQGMTGQGTREDPIVVGTWSDLKSALDSNPLAGESAENPTYYRLSGNVTAGTTDVGITVGLSRHVVLDLNGNTIDRNKPQSGSFNYALAVNGDVTVTGGGTITGATSYCVTVRPDGTFTMESGTISGNGATNADGGGVYVNGGTFTMKGGTICKNTASNGGGVYANASTFTMTNGTISENTASNLGGGVYVNDSTFTMSGGTVSSNKAPYCGGVVVRKQSSDNSSTFTMSDTAAVSNNTSTGYYTYGAGVDVADSTFTMTGGSVTGNCADHYGGGVRTKDSTFNVSGSVEISGNTLGTSDRNVVLYSGQVITVNGVLSNTTPIGVSFNETLAKDTDFTSGFSTQMGTDADPSDYFKSEQGNYGVLLNTAGTEAMLGKANTVTFYANGGSGTMNAQPVKPGKTVALKSNTFTRRGHAFTGWNTDPSGTGSDSYEDGASITLSDDISLYAQWTANALTVDDIADQQYTGVAIKPEVTVRDGSVTLTNDTDYTVSYESNTNVGTAKVIVTGKGDYADSAAVSKTFNIIEADASATDATVAKVARPSAVGAAASRSFKVSWKAAEGAKKYQVQWRAAGGKWTTRSAKGTTYTVKGLKTGTAYEFRVRGVSGLTKGAWSASARRWLRGASKVKAATGKKSGTVRVSWAKDAKANAGHTVYVYAKRGGKAVKVVTVAKGKTAATIKGLKAGKTYYVRVRPLRRASGSTFTGIISGYRAVKAAK